MTYCVGLLVDTGLVMLSDSRTNAGVDQINTFRKMVTFQRPGDRILVLLSAGNLAITQAVVHTLQELPGELERPRIQCDVHPRRPDRGRAAAAVQRLRRRQFHRVLDGYPVFPNRRVQIR